MFAQVPFCNFRTMVGYDKPLVLYCQPGWSTDGQLLGYRSRLAGGYTDARSHIDGCLNCSLLYEL